MPFYKISELEKVNVAMGEAVMQTVVGELMKAGMITYQVGGGPPEQSQLIEISQLTRARVRPGRNRSERTGWSG